MYEQWIIALLIAPLAVALINFAVSGSKNRNLISALHVTGLVLMVIFALQVIRGVLAQNTIEADRKSVV